VEPVRQLLNTAAGLPELCRSASTGQTGTLRLGFVSTAGFGPLPAWLRSFQQNTPHVAVQLRESTSDVQLAALAEGTLDAGLVVHSPGMNTEAHQAFEHLSVGREPLLFALPTAQTAKQRRLTPSELLCQPLIIFPRATAPSLHDAILAFFHHHNVVPVIAQQAIQMQTIVNLVSAGLGIALVPRVVATFRRSGVTYRPIPRTLSHAPRSETSLVWRTKSPPSVLRFVEHVRRCTAKAR
jgi:DNA-binding transcriptional LysR family regulator